MNREILNLKNLSVSYGDINILKDIDLSLKKGEILGIVGESGSGKSTLIKSIMGILDENASIDGEINFEGKDLASLSLKDYRKIKGKEISMIFQNPTEYFNPTRKISKQFIETIRSHNDISKQEIQKKSINTFKFLGLQDGKKIWNSYPFELSGGMNQRVAIALSIMLEPKILLADEPTSALDVTVQAQVVKEILKLRQKLNTSIILVTHNIGVASYMSDNIGVMYGGRIIEYGESEELINNPKHPYTKMLINSVPVINGNIPNGIEGSLPNFQDIKEGCVFLDRCKYASRECKIKVPSAKYWGKSHWSSCLIENEEIAL
ncbi:oligopeptide/dipeptide ABC transporter, ATP-binding protein, C-terminal domain-containing protein [Intestinibacter bartlettii DSM 16795]|jgi:oligopeptide/dipeptide ABC transporter ATP-binding protein|uniref:ABC transporter ATP-binding protein n=1 Tax=Intestinibacter bartlettii TaxID=261299 RepID=UPI0002E17E75|nr:ABC transporter ATP-binding protein [Intestinibacter bartlettii]UWO81904.1 ABC transporter ATP-binding protein [Intestinibacter bartlettii]SKA61217.1 oligopeptide/dipeptide ABC transporter, ATP-binding protein, C-terminal domain-containing protein [Intestinibacter bartlettii DSM 16795]